MAKLAQRLYFTGYGLSAIGTGMWYPTQGIFLTTYRHLPVNQVGWYFAAVALGAILANLPASTFADRRGPFGLFAAAGILQGLGLVLAGFMPNFWTIEAGGVLSGVGNGAFFAVQTAVLLRLFGEAKLGSIFGRQYQINNAGLGLGAAFGAVLANTSGLSGFVVIVAVNAASSALHTVNVVLLVRPLVRRRGEILPVAPTRLPVIPWRAVLRPYLDRRFLPLIGLQFGFMVFGICQIEAVMPLALRRYAGMPAWTVTLLIAVNGLTVVLGQGAGTRLATRFGEQRAICVTGCMWLSALIPGYIVITSKSFVWQVAAVMAFTVLFAAGEVLFAPSVQPLAVKLAPKDRVAGYSGALSLAFGLGGLVGPALSMVLISMVDYRAYSLVLALGLTVCTALVWPRQAGGLQGVEVTS